MKGRGPVSQTNHDAAIVRALQGIEKHNRELVRVMEALNTNFVAFGKIVKEAMEPLDETVDPNQAVLPIDPDPGVKFEIQEFNPELVGDADPFNEPFVYGKHPFAWSNSFKTIGRPLQVHVDGDDKKVLLDFNGSTQWVPIEDLRGANDGT
jgi:hypothetical protein